MDAAPGRVLIVEDDPLITELVEQVLVAAGYTLASVPTGEAGWECIQAEHFDPVILDLMLPGVDGLTICEWARHRTGVPYLPIIMLTAKAQPADRHEGFGAGADDYICKPFDTLELLDRVHVWYRASQRLQAAYAREQELERARTEQARLAAILLAVRTMQHEVNERLATAVGFGELLKCHPDLPVQCVRLAAQALEGAVQAAEALDQLRGLTRIEEQSWGPGVPTTIRLDGTVE